MTCNCSRPHWSAEELFQKADLLSAILMGHESVTGVAVTGSVARIEPEVHDLDIVVLHDSTLPTGGFRQYGGNVEMSDHLALVDIIGEKIANRLDIARGNVPTTYLLAKESTLWSCADLQALAEKEIQPGFWRTVFSQTPLLLLDHRGRRLAQFVESQDKQSRTVRSTIYEVWQVRHRCGSDRCYPLHSWEETHRMIRERKAAREQRALSGVFGLDLNDDS